ncbi:hypothetical protein FVEN_g13132 [Fusarium venenatum]|nr:hypothetical protein FVEN_g13132 [Fusarium venenatum]
MCLRLGCAGASNAAKSNADKIACQEMNCTSKPCAFETVFVVSG